MKSILEFIVKNKIKQTNKYKLWWMSMVKACFIIINTKKELDEIINYTNLEIYSNNYDLLVRKLKMGYMIGLRPIFATTTETNCIMYDCISSEHDLLGHYTETNILITLDEFDVDTWKEKYSDKYKVFK